MDTRVEQRPAPGVPTDTFAARLMLARMHAGHLSIRQAADKCGIGRGAWTNWERGARPVGEATIAQRIADGLGVDRDWLLWGGPLATEVRRRRDRHGRREPTEKKLLKAIGHGRPSPRTDTGEVSTRRTGRRFAAGRPIVAHAA
jgi:transcriptional regulator with XRE-family HTH domain